MTRIARNLALAISACAMCAISSPGFAAVLAANNDMYTIVENTPLTNNVFVNDIIPATDTVTDSIVMNPTDGTLSLSLFNGMFTYTPNSNFFGVDMFKYAILDETTNTTSNTATVTIVVNQAIVSTTPLPAALPLFATGLGAMGLFGWRRKRKAQAVAA